MLVAVFRKSGPTQFLVGILKKQYTQFTIAKYWKQPKCPSANEWVHKLWYIYTMEFYAAERKKELIPFLQWHGWNRRALC